MDTKKAPRKHQAQWQDNTSTARSNKRQAQLEAAAKRDGFSSASAAITAWKNGEAVMILVERREKTGG